MIIFKVFRGLENLYIKFQDLPYFSRICTNPVFTIGVNIDVVIVIHYQAHCLL